MGITKIKSHLGGGGDERSHKPQFLAIMVILLLVSAFLIINELYENESDAEDSCDNSLPTYGATAYKLQVACSPSSTWGTYKVSGGYTIYEGDTITKSGNVLKIGSTTVTATAASPHGKFSGWDQVPTGTVTGNINALAVFGDTGLRKVTFISKNPSYGTVSKSSLNVSAGCSYSVSGSTLTIDSQKVYANPASTTNYYSYSFTKWERYYGSIPGTISSTTISATFYAYFSESTRYYSVYIQPDNASYGDVSKNSVSVTYNTSISVSGSSLKIGSTTITAIPTDDDAQYNYEFSSWSNASGSVTGSRTIKALFTRTLQQYDVNFVANDDGWGAISPSTITVPYGTGVSASGGTLTIGTTTVTATPSPDDSSYTYAFSSWQNVPTTITGATTITAIFAATQAGHTVQYYYDGSKISGYDELVPHGGTITHTTYSNGDLIFCGWYTDSSLASQYLFNNSTQVTQNYVLYALMAEPITFTSSPVADASITYLSWAGMVLFDSVGANSPYRVVWDFGDGTSSTDRTTYHLYSEPGTYTVKLSAYNYAGDVDTKEYHITISNEHQQQSDSTAIYAGAFIAAIVSLLLISRIF